MISSFSSGTRKQMGAFRQNQGQIRPDTSAPFLQKLKIENNAEVSTCTRR